MHYALSTRLLVAIGSWCLARAGVEWHIGPAAGPVAHSLRDKRGRFRPKHGGGYGFPREVPHKVADLLHGMGVTQQMYEHAYVPLVLPDDIEDIDALERRLREWISNNINHWVTDGRRSIGMVMRALMWTYAITFYRYQPPQKMVAWYMRHVAAGTRMDPNVGESAWVGASPVPARVELNLADEHSEGEDLASSRSESTLGNISPLETIHSRASDNFIHQPILDQSHTVGYHRDTETPSRLNESSVSLCLCGEYSDLPSTEQPRAASTPAGGRKVLPYDPNSLHPPDPPWYSPPPHPPPSPHGTLKI